MTMNEVVNFALPTGYHVSFTDVSPSVACDRGCGWKLRVATLSGLPSEAREQLFRCHEAWHMKRR
jgi:hypothetical protein